MGSGPNWIFTERVLFTRAPPHTRTFVLITLALAGVGKERHLAYKRRFKDGGGLCADGNRGPPGTLSLAPYSLPFSPHPHPPA